MTYEYRGNITTRDRLTGAFRVGGAMPRVSKVGQYFPEWGVGEDCPLIPVDQWGSQPSLRSYEWRDIYQNGYPSCCICATCNAMEMTLARNGRAKTPLDWLGTWKELTGGRGGVAVDTALKYAMDQGIILEDKSCRLKLLEAWDANSIEAAASGLLRGFTLVFGHDVHAECGTRLVLDNNQWCVDTRNSWGKNWGDQGWHLFPLKEIEIQTYGAFLVREVELRPIDITGMEDAKP